MRPALLALALVAVSAISNRVTLAGDPPKPPAAPKPTDEPAGGSEKPAGKPTAAKSEYKGPEIAWVLSLADAVEEAAQRNVLLYVHSHGST